MGAAEEHLAAGGIYPLFSNGNFVVSSPNKKVGSNNLSGAVALVDGITGNTIATLSGESANDYFGFGGMLAKSRYDKLATTHPEASFLLTTSAQTPNGMILLDSSGNTQSTSTTYNFTYDEKNAKLGGITALKNGNFVISSIGHRVGGIAKAGSVKLVNGTTGALIATLAGATDSDHIGSTYVRALSNSNYVVASPLEDVGGLVNAGTVRLIRGSDGQVLATFSGAAANYQLGSGAVVELPDGGFAFGSATETVSGVANVGRIRIVNADGTLRSLIDGLSATDGLGSSSISYPGLVRLGDNALVAISTQATVGGVANVGRARLINATSGADALELTGLNLTDNLGSAGIVPLSQNRFILRSPNHDHSGVTNAGMLHMIWADDLNE